MNDNLESDIYISTGKNSKVSIDRFITLIFGGTTEFERLVLETTPISRIFAYISQFISSSQNNSKQGSDSSEALNSGTSNYGELQTYYEISKNDLEKLAEIPSIPGKKFVFAHIVSAHRPFVFSGDGSFAARPINSRVCEFDHVYKPCHP